VYLLQRFLWKLVPPFEVMVTSKEINAFLEKHAFLSREIIARDTLALVKIAEKTVYSVRIDGLKPDRLALILITNVLGDHISSGRYHTYRGFLNMIGNDMLKVWHTAINTLREKGYYSESEAEDDRKWIREQIKNAG